MGWGKFCVTVLVAVIARWAGGSNPGGTAGGQPCPSKRPPGGNPKGTAARPPSQPKQ
jgi:hypothetical protein